MNRALLVAVALTAGAVAGCVGGTGRGEDGPAANLDFPRGVHPWPVGDGSEWPAALSGPFKMLLPENVKIPSFDGILLDTWILRPEVPGGTKVPVVLWSAPYFGLNNAAGNDPTGWDNSDASEAVPVNLLVENGYAVAIMNLRGSGNSQGCYQLFGSIDWKDNAAAVEWLGTQEWSNGRVGMMGLSYHGTTPWMAAVEAPPHLKTIVTAGMVSNLYTFFHTQQGAHLTIGAPFSTELNAIGMAPPLFASPADLLGDWPGTLATKVCPELVPVMTEVYKSAYTDERDAAFWEDRNLLRRYENITASVFLTHGLLDYHGSGHQMQEDFAWANLPADVPKRMMVGQWEHMFPNFSERYTGSGRDWDAEMLPWFEFWLKGIGDPSDLKLGVVDYQDSEDRWRATEAWPPPEGEPRALYLSAGKLGASAASGTASFKPRPMAEFYDAICDPQVPGQPIGLLYQTEPFAQQTSFAGNPFAILELEADQPGGQVAAFLVAIEDGGVRCGTPIAEGPNGIRFLSMGVADLRHHAGNYRGTDFPVGTATPVRIDLNNIAEVLGVGERLGLLLAYGDATVDGPTEYMPTITVHEGRSHVVVPVAAGAVDGSLPWVEYPARPFDPLGGDP